MSRKVLTVRLYCLRKVWSPHSWKTGRQCFSVQSICHLDCQSFCARLGQWVSLWLGTLKSHWTWSHTLWWTGNICRLHVSHCDGHEDCETTCIIRSMRSIPRMKREEKSEVNDTHSCMWDTFAENWTSDSSVVWETDDISPSCERVLIRWALKDQQGRQCGWDTALSY